MKKNCIPFVLTAVVLASLSCSDSTGKAGGEPGQEGALIENLVMHTAVGDWGTVVRGFDVTAVNKKALKNLKAEDFDIVNNAPNTMYDPATGESVKAYAEDGISISRKGRTLTIQATPFDAEGARGQRFQKEPWKVVCTQPGLSFSASDVDDTTIDIIDECIRGSYSFGGITREYMLYLPKDEKGNEIKNVPLFVWQIGGGEYDKDMMTAALANRCLTSLPEHGEKCATLVFAIANPNYSYSASLDPEKIKLIDLNNALQMSFIDSLIEEGKVDGSRLFCAGASSGGGCTIRFMMQFADRFKAAIPVCSMDPVVPIHKVQEAYPGQFADDLEKTFSSDCVYKWNGTEMELQKMDVAAFTKLPMYFVHAADDNTCKVISTYSYIEARRRLGAKDDQMRIFSDADMKEYGFGGFLSHFSWCRMLDDYTEGSAMDWLVKQL